MRDQIERDVVMETSFRGGHPWYQGRIVIVNAAHSYYCNRISWMNDHA